MILHNHAIFKTSENWDFYRSLHLGTRGWAGCEYYLVCKTDGKKFGFDTQRDANRFLTQAGVEITWQHCNEYNEILGK